jgi:hypothetical protein
MTETNLIEDFRLLHPPNFAWMLWLALVAVAVAALIWLTRRRTSSATCSEPVNSLAVWDETLRELERLLPLLRPDQSRAYAIASTHLIRRYLERRHGLAAPRLATEEFLAAARHSAALSEADRARLEEYLRWCDLLKFGRARAETTELQHLHEAAVEFVSASRPADVAAARQSAGNAIAEEVRRSAESPLRFNPEAGDRSKGKP